MAWEWVSSASSAAVGISAIFGTAWASVRSRKHDRAMAADRQTHDRQIAHEQWIREHRNDAYIGLLDLAEQVGGLYVQRVHPMWRPAADPASEPQLPSYEAQQLVRARIMAYGSEAVKDRMSEWNALVQEAIKAAADISGDVAGSRSRLHDLRQQEVQARKALGNQVAAELQGNPSQEVERRPLEGS